MRTKPIMPMTMFRNVLGRAGGYRGLRILPVEGTIVGVPSGPTNQHATRNLYNMALAFDADGKASVQVYLSLGIIDSAFHPTQSEFTRELYERSLFVTVRPHGAPKDGSEDKVCINLLMFSGCPVFTGIDDDIDWNTEEMNPVTIPAQWAGIGVDSITVPNTHDTEDFVLWYGLDYFITQGNLVFTADFLDWYFHWQFGAFDGTRHCIELTVHFDNECDPVTITVCRIEEEVYGCFTIVGAYIDSYGGQDYEVGDLLRVEEGEYVDDNYAIFEVTEVGEYGEILGVEIVQGGNYSTMPGYYAWPTTDGAGSHVLLYPVYEPIECIVIEEDDDDDDIADDDWDYDDDDDDSSSPD